MGYKPIADIAEANSVLAELYGQTDALMRGLKAAGPVLYPVGTILNCAVSTNPTTLLGFGTWVQIKADVDRIHAGSIALHPGLSGSTTVAKTVLVGCYGTGLIDPIFKDAAGAQMTPPSGYHREYKLTAQAWTSMSNVVWLYLGNKKTYGGGTWSPGNFKGGVSTGFLKEADIAWDDTYPIWGLGGSGICVWYEVTAAVAPWSFSEVTVDGYLVSDDVRYAWKRIA